MNYSQIVHSISNGLHLAVVVLLFLMSSVSRRATLTRRRTGSYAAPSSSQWMQSSARTAVPHGVGLDEEKQLIICIIHLF